MAIKDESYGIIPFYISNSIPIFLIIKHRAGHWDFPKGHKELGESDDETRLRELKEETGIEEIPLLIGEDLLNEYNYSLNGSSFDKTIYFKLGKFSGEPKVVIDNNEVIDYQWKNFEEARKLITFENARKILDEALQNLNK